ncbi:hypothetical protein SADUNF_Sadunf06G0193000 [Salix dunnii]|uniref:E2 ubiquitin-conjugating enzyme n=1 Tax=Salix dunnii TaxID=1413687 RepID=A0A835MXQ1_9ROSI|nr:hypothetical protein SADUNF_Sadunf06G0193000 [Salix dunnii]
MQASRARLLKEYKEVQREKVADPDIQLVCDDSNIFKWTALIKGPSETPFEGGVFQLAFSVPEQYPLQPPQVRFLTKIFHPNVHFKTGEICLDILKNAWSPAWTLQSVCRAIIALMAHPEPDSPLNCDSEIGENSVSSYLWDGKTESKILRQFLIKGPERLGISLRQYPPLFFAKACLSYFAIPISIVASIGGLELLQLRMQGSEMNWHCNLLRSGDVRGYQSMARMYTRLAASPKKG